MLTWQNACESDKRLFVIICQLFINHQNLILFIFDPKFPRLKTSSEEIKSRAMALSSGENVLVRLALDIWEVSGGVRVLDICQVLDDQNFRTAILTLGYLR